MCRRLIHLHSLRILDRRQNGHPEHTALVTQSGPPGNKVSLIEYGQGKHFSRLPAALKIMTVNLNSILEL
jgi:hypothetical protein